MLTNSSTAIVPTDGGDSNDHHPHPRRGTGPARADPGRPHRLHRPPPGLLAQPGPAAVPGARRRRHLGRGDRGRRVRRRHLGARPLRLVRAGGGPAGGHRLQRLPSRQLLGIPHQPGRPRRQPRRAHRPPLAPHRQGPPADAAAGPVRPPDLPRRPSQEPADPGRRPRPGPGLMPPRAPLRPVRGAGAAGSPGNMDSDVRELVAVPAGWPSRPRLRRGSRRRRPSGQPPPLPHHLRSSGAGWLIAAIVLTAGSVVIFARGLRGPAVGITVADDAVTRWLATVRVPGLTSAAWDLADAGAIPAMVTIGYGLVAALLVLRRFRHLLVFVASFEVANVLSGAMQLVVHRPRPFGVPVRFGWGGFALPSVQILYLCVVVVGVLYTLVPAGRWRNIGKLVAAGLVALAALA